MHLALLPAGRWFDEYFTFSFFRVWGLGGLMFRLRHWSLRPVSDGMVYGYWLLVHATGRPLIVPALGLAWGILAALLTAAIRPWQLPGRMARWALLLALPVLFLLAGPVGEMWYWPLAAFAYLPTLGGVCVAVLMVAGPGLRGDRGWIAVAAALTLAAFSSEVGALFTLVLCPLLFVDRFLGGAPARQAAVLAVPLVAAGVVMISLVTGRAASPAELMVPGPLFRHPIASVLAAIPHVLGGAAGVGDGVWPTLRGVAARLLLCLGAWAVLRLAWPAPVSRRLVMIVGSALVGACLLSVAGSFYQFGTLCCERHEALRQAMDLLMAVAVAGLLPRNGVVGRGGTHGVLAPPALLAAAALVGAPPRVVALAAEYRVAHAQAKAQKAMWRSGQDRANPTLEMVQTPEGPLLAGYHVAPGIYDLAH